MVIAKTDRGTVLIADGLHLGGGSIGVGGGIFITVGDGMEGSVIVIGIAGYSFKGIGFALYLTKVE